MKGTKLFPKALFLVQNGQAWGCVVFYNIMSEKMQ